MKEIITRKQARNDGLVRYFTGSPCLNGHVDERLTSNATCVVCALSIAKKSGKKYRSTESGKIKAAQRVYKYLKTEKGQKTLRSYKSSYEFKAKRSESYKKWYEENKNNPKYKAARLESRRKMWTNSDYRKRISEQVKKKKGSDINFKISCNIRSRICKAMRGKCKSGSAISSLGCTLDYFYGYIESLFVSGMSWSNYGEWHIDHKMPLCKFDLSNEIDFNLACNYLNMQPLWAKDNMSKGGKYAA